MRKLSSVILSLALCFSLCAPAFATDNVTTEPISEVPLQTEPSLFAMNRYDDPDAFSAAQAKYVEEIKDELYEEIAKYQANTASTRGVTYGGFIYRKGDIIVTKSTSSNGLVGHVGIVTNDTIGKVLEITPKYNDGVPRSVDLITWFQCYPTAMVLRRNTSDGTAAANYGVSFYEQGSGSDNTYSLTSSITSSTKDYCSSLVWKCYYRGADYEFLVSNATDDVIYWERPVLIYPYDYITYRDYNGFTAVHSVDW